MLDSLEGLASLMQGAATVARALEGGTVPQLVGEWAQQLLVSAPGKWLPVLARQERCAHARCSQQAVVECVVCKSRTCLHHALVGADGNGICHDCVLEAAASRKAAAAPKLKEQPRRRSGKAAAKPPVDPYEGLPAAVRRAYEELKCSPADSFEHIQNTVHARVRMAKTDAERRLIANALNTLSKFHAAA